VPVYMRYLRASEFAALSLLIPTLTLIAIVLKAGLNHAFFRHYYDTEDPAIRRKIVGSTLLFLLFASSLATLLLSSIAPELSRFIFTGDKSRTDLLKLVFYTSFFEVITLIPDSILRVKFKSAQYSTLNVIAFVGQLALICYLVLAVDASAHSVLLGRLVGSAFEAALFFVMVRKELSLSFSGKELRGMLAFGAPLIFGQVSFQLFIMIDRFFLERYTTDRELGAYGMACTLVSVVGILVTVPFSQVWTVMRFSVMNDEGAEEYYSRVLTYIVLVSMFFSLGVAAVAGDGILLFATKGYWTASAMIPLLALSTVFDSASRVLNIGITLRKRTIFAPLVIVAALGVNIGLNFWLIPRYGAMGASVATLLSYVAFCAFRYFASNLFFKVRYEWGRVLTLIAVGGLLVACFYFNDYLRGDTPSRIALYVSALSKGLLAVSFPVLLIGLRFYDERERRRIAELWQRVLTALRLRRLTEA
jgi:O-antigen/teichoic acid export membrane protein